MTISQLCIVVAPCALTWASGFAFAATSLLPHAVIGLLHCGHSGGPVAASLKVWVSLTSSEVEHLRMPPLDILFLGKACWSHVSLYVFELYQCLEDPEIWCFKHGGLTSDIYHFYMCICGHMCVGACVGSCLWRAASALISPHLVLWGRVSILNPEFNNSSFISCLALEILSLPPKCRDYEWVAKAIQYSCRSRWSKLRSLSLCGNKPSTEP